MLKVKSEKLGDVTVLHLRGGIVNGVAATLREAVFTRAQGAAIVLDLAKVDLIDASGLGTLLELREWTQSKGIEFKLMNVSRFVRRVLEVTRLDSVFEILSQETLRSGGASSRWSARWQYLECTG